MTRYYLTLTSKSRLDSSVNTFQVRITRKEFLEIVNKYSIVYDNDQRL